METKWDLVEVCLVCLFTQKPNNSTPLFPMEIKKRFAQLNKHKQNEKQQQQPRKEKKKYSTKMLWQKDD